MTRVWQSGRSDYRARRNDKLKGWLDCSSFDEADRIRAEKKALGLVARVTDLGGWRPGDDIKPHRVSWWPLPLRGTAQAIEARRAATAKTDAVEDESAVGNADAPNSPNNPPNGSNRA